MYFFIILCFFWIFYFIWDISSDWNTYHLYSILKILEWKKVIYDSFWEYFKYLDFYPKHIEIIFSWFSSVFWLWQERLFKVFLIISSFLNYLYLLKKLDKKANFINILIWIFLILNPVVIYQFFSLYIDDVLYLLFLNGAFYIFIWEYILWIALFSLCAWAKINYSVFSLIWLTLSYYFRNIYILKSKFFKNFKIDFLSKKMVLIITFLAILWLHQNILNTFKFQNPFYWFIWSGKEFSSSMANDKPPLLKENKLSEFYYTYFSYSNIDCKITNKCLETFDFTNINWLKKFISSYKLSYIYDLQTSWFWNLFIFIFIINLIIIFYIIFSKIKQKNFDNEFKILAFLSLFLIIILILMPIYWARYISLIWIFSILWIIFCKNNFIKKFSIILIFINLVLILWVNWYFYANKFIFELKQKNAISSEVKKTDEIFVYKNDDTKSFSEFNFLSKYNSKAKIIYLSEKNMLNFCWIKSKSEVLNAWLNILKCPNNWIIFIPNKNSFIDEIYFINTNNSNNILNNFISNKPKISISNTKNEFCKNNDLNIDWLIISSCDINNDFVEFSKVNCWSWYELLSLNDWGKIINSFWINKNQIFEKLNISKNWYIDEKNNYINNSNNYYLTSDLAQNRVKVIILNKNKLDFEYTKPINQKFLYRCKKTSN